MLKIIGVKELRKLQRKDVDKKDIKVKSVVDNKIKTWLTIS